MPTTATGVRREHIEAFLAEIVDRLAAASVTPARALAGGVMSFVIQTPKCGVPRLDPTR